MLTLVFTPAALMARANVQAWWRRWRARSPRDDQDYRLRPRPSRELLPQLLNCLPGAPRFRDPWDGRRGTSVPHSRDNGPALRFARPEPAMNRERPIGVPPGLRDAAERGGQAEPGENPRQQREVLRHEARKREEQQRLAALGEAAQVVERLPSLALVREPALGGEDRVGEERRPGADEAQQQEERRHDVAGRRQREADDQRVVDEEIQHDVEVAAEVGDASLPRHRAVEAVGEAVRQQEAETQQGLALRDRCRGAEAEGEADDGDRVGAEAGSDQRARRPGQRLVDQAPDEGVEHGRLTLTKSSLSPCGRGPG